MVIKGNNIILIGMSGCGKTIIGQILSERLNMEFCDVDHYIEEKESKTIVDIFNDSGEEYFRRLESKAIKEISRCNGLVISTGGGVIKSELNMNHLRKSGIIIFVNRSVEDIMRDIDIKGRPLLRKGKEQLYKLYNERIDLYKKYCDYEVINDNKIEDVITKILDVTDYHINGARKIKELSNNNLY